MYYCSYGGLELRKQVALYYNPVSGGGRFKNRLDEVIGHLQEAGLQVLPWRIRSNQDIADHLPTLDPGGLHTVAAAGGDGTIHGLVNAMMKCGYEVPIAILPEGTANDVAVHLSIPMLPEEYCRIITDGRLANIDLGKVNDTYFVNVASAGLLTETAHEVQYRWKNILGRGAYYIKSLEKLQRVHPMRLKMSVDGKKTNMTAAVFLILNGGTAGGFQGLTPESDMNDGLLDFLAIKSLSLPMVTHLLIKFLRGQLLQDGNTFYCQGRHFTIELSSETTTDLDGEIGPSMPWDITVVPSALKIWLPKQEA